MSIITSILMAMVGVVWLLFLTRTTVTLMAFNWLGDGLRDAFDPRMRR
jgi:ABC-type dipeptide/oligopeptide/nickel transport system permease subunit